jgi:type IV pilus assembly protein PilA
MLRSRIRRRAAAADGLSLVEVLVVVLIIGTLAAIAVGGLLNQRSKSQDTLAKAAVTTAAKAMLAFNDDHGDFDGATPDDLVRIEPALAQAGLTVDSDADSFTVTVSSPSAPGASYSIERSRTGAVRRTCSRPGHGSCLAAADSHGNRW